MTALTSHLSPLISLAALALFLPTLSSEAGWQWFSPELGRLEEKQARATLELETLGTPVVGQTVAQLGYQHPRLPAPPLTPAWIQVDLLSPQAIDYIALVPAQVDWQSYNRPAYGFPPRFRIDLSEDPTFREFYPVAVFTEEDFPAPGVAAVTLPARGRVARYVRLTVTKMAQENDQHFYALGELMVISSNLNLAVHHPVTASATINLLPRWSVQNLVDGRTPLGPPIRRELLEWDGLYAGPAADGSPPWMRLDLGREFPLQQLRLHPVHARIGADVPGFSFPKGFRVETSRTADFTEATLLLNTGDYRNPGNNPVTILARDTVARYVRILGTDTDQAGQNRFGLSEVEVYSHGTNVARGAQVTAVPDPQAFSSHWPPSLLVDGFNSYGRLLELPEWLQSWEQRRELQAELSLLGRQHALLLAAAQRRALAFGIGLLIAGVILLGTLLLLARRRRARDLQDLRLRLARDLHDEIGSNLAGIAVLSEVAREEMGPGAAQREDWQEVNRIAHETIHAMREVIWLIGGREEAGLDWMAHLQLAASRMLAGKEVHWTATLAQVPDSWPMEDRRQVFLFFKEALTNIVRHARASRVDLSVRLEEGQLFLDVIDQGCGFVPAQARRGTGLESLQARARALGGRFLLESAPGRGTRLSLQVPLNKRQTHLPFGRKSEELKP